MKKATLLFVSVLIINSLSFAAIKKGVKESYKWYDSSLFYFNVPVNERLEFSQKDKKIHPFGAGFQIINPYSVISKTFAFEIEYADTGKSINIKEDNLWMLTLKYGLTYISDKKENKKFSFISSVFADLGLANEKVFFTPEFSAGFLYFTNDYNRESFVFSLFYRPFKINTGTLSGYNDVKIKPVLGIRAGYLFEGFWSKE